MADGQMLRVIVYDYQDRYVCDIDPSQIVELKSTEEINGEHSLTIKTAQELEKTDRLVIRDGMGIWHEYVVTGLVGEHGGRKVGAVIHTYHAVWSLQYDLSATYIDTQVGLVPGKPSVPAPALSGLQAALSGTGRWKVGTITVTSSGSASFYRRSGWEGIKTLTENWGGEVEATIDVGRTGVVGRYVDFLAHEGNEEATRRFDYGGDVSKIKRTVSDEVWPCRIVPLGKATETEAGGYSRRPTIAEANGGVVWLEDESAVPFTRIPDGEGGWEYPTAIIKNDVYSDPAQLKAWAIEHIGEYTRPQVTYEADVVQLVRAGMNPHGVALGDNVVVVDRSFGGSGIAIDARVIKIVQSLIDSTDVKLTIGNAKQSISTALVGLSRDVERVTEQQVIASAYQATAAYMSALLDRLNAEINATGGYWYMIPGIGTRTYDVEVSDPAVGVEASKVVEVRGGNIRIANSRTATGEWDWRTVFQSGHILADLVTSAKLTAGYIGSADSGNFWDLDSGEFRMASTAQLGSKTVQQVIDAVDETITGVDVEFAQGDSPTQAPTGGWGTSAPTWQEGKYIWTRTKTTTPSGTSYSTPAMISGRDGTDGTSVTIRGSYSTLAELEAAHPTGSDGDAYMVGADLYVWNGTAWEDVGQIQGPQGPAGTSVTVTNIQYGISASASAAPSSWDTTPPTSIGGGKWLWVRTNYSNGSAATTKSYVGTNGTSVYVQSSTKVDGVTTVVLASSDGTTSTIRIADGEDGATGQRGPAGANGESNYIHTAWANSQDGTVDFSTTVSANKSYLGVCTDQNEADPTTPSSYSWSKIEGAAGADGVGVSGFVEQYYLSTSSSAQSGGSWTTDQPDYRTGRFYWTRTITTYSDGRVDISDPVLARGLTTANSTAASAQTTATTANNAIKGLTVSATNLIRNGNFEADLRYWQAVETTASVVSDSTFGKVAKVAAPNGILENGLHATSFSHVAGKTYSISFWAKCGSYSGYTFLSAVVGGTDGSLANRYVYSATLDTRWKQYTATITPTIGGELVFHHSGGDLYIANVMLVEASRPMMDYLPSPADTEAQTIAYLDENIGGIFDEYLTQQEVFNRLTNDGALQGLYMNNNQLYINGTFIKSGSINADLITTGTISADLVSGGTLQGVQVIAQDSYHRVVVNNGTYYMYSRASTTAAWALDGIIQGGTKGASSSRLITMTSQGGITIMANSGTLDEQAKDVWTHTQNGTHGGKGWSGTISIPYSYYNGSSHYTYTLDLTVINGRITSVNAGSNATKTNW